MEIGLIDIISSEIKLKYRNRYIYKIFVPIAQIFLHYKEQKIFLDLKNNEWGIYEKTGKN